VTRYATRLKRLEALTPKGERRIILVWVDKEGRRTKVADTMPDLPDNNHYDRYMAGCGGSHETVSLLDQ